MAGMFYSLQEAAEKLGISEEELKQWAQDGKLRDFRDGQSVMFKVDEVEALLGQSDVDDLDLPVLDLEGSEGQDLPDLEPMLDLELDEDSEPKAAQESEPEELDEDLSLDEPLELAPESTTEEGDAGLDDLMLAMDDDEAPAKEPAGEAQEDLLLEPIEEEESTLNLSDTQLISDEEPAEVEDLDVDEISDDLLLSETNAGGDDQSELSSMDTALTGEGVDIFGGSEAEFKLSDDSMAETMAGLGEIGEASSLEEIEEDVNLDSFGSGSGLLDLSLQADDTSLGGILDEIYTAEDEDAGAPEGSIEDMTEAADSMPLEEVHMDAPLPVVAATTAAEIPADAQSNFFGGLLFLPLLILLYTGIAALGGMLGGLNLLVNPLKGIIWYVVGGLVVLAIILTAVGFTRGESAGPKTAKKPQAKKEKKPKRQKPKKEKKVKEKKPKGGKKK